jgi:hypothetical protein
MRDEEFFHGKIRVEKDAKSRIFSEREEVERR